MRHQPIPSATSAATDVVYTPHQWASCVVNLLPLHGKVLDAAKGNGAFYDIFPDHVEKKWCEITEGRDFFQFTDRVDWIVTNPPWSRIREFLDHAMDIADNVVFLITTNHAYTKSRMRLVEEKGFAMRGLLHMPTPPKPWPQSGFQLSAIWWMRGYLGDCETLFANDRLGEAA